MMAWETPRPRRRRSSSFVILRQIVSAVPKRKWYNVDGFNVDLTRFPDKRLVVMAWPGETINFRDPKRSKLVRNDADEVKHCLQQFFPKGFKVYNLCCESQSFRYSQELNVAQYGWLDHEPPPFKLFVDLIADIRDYLARNPENGVAIHCKAGKGRTGTTTAAYLLNEMNNADQALAQFGVERFGNVDYGVTIPSQKRYVRYYEKFIRSPSSDYLPQKIQLSGIRIRLTHELTQDCQDQLTKSVFKISARKYDNEERDKFKELELVNKSEVKGIPVDMTTVELVFKRKVEMCGDFKLNVTQKDSSSTVFKVERTICSFWLNTAFHTEKEITLTSAELDWSKKEKDCRDRVASVTLLVT